MEKKTKSLPLKISESTHKALVRTAYLEHREIQDQARYWIEIGRVVSEFRTRESVSKKF